MQDKIDHADDPGRGVAHITRKTLGFLMLGLTWSGDVPSQKWMNFYTKVITKLGVGNDLSLNVKVKCKPQGGVSKQKIEEIKSALRELGLDDNL